MLLSLIHLSVINNIIIGLVPVKPSKDLPTKHELVEEIIIFCIIIIIINSNVEIVDKRRLL